MRLEWVLKVRRVRKGGMYGSPALLLLPRGETVQLILGVFDESRHFQLTVIHLLHGELIDG